MMELAADHPVSKVAQILGRSEGAVETRMREVNARLRRNGGHYTIAETAKILGMDKDWVKDELRPGGALRPRGKRSKYAALHPGLISEATIRRFLITYAWMIRYSPHDLPRIVHILTQGERVEA